MRKFPALFLSIMLLLIAACQKEETGKDKLQYFDLTGFIDDEVKKLSAQNPVIEKMVFLNGETEQKRDTVGNWENELNAFREADINKRSFLGKYLADSVFEGGLLSVKYSAMNEKFRTRELAVQYDSNRKPIKISVAVAASNVLYSSRHDLVYEPGKGYSISGKQIIRFLEPDSFYVEAKIKQSSGD